MFTYIHSYRLWCPVSIIPPPTPLLHAFWFLLMSFPFRRSHEGPALHTSEWLPIIPNRVLVRIQFCPTKLMSILACSENKWSRCQGRLRIEEFMINNLRFQVLGSLSVSGIWRSATQGNISDSVLADTREWRVLPACSKQESKFVSTPPIEVISADPWWRVAIEELCVDIILQDVSCSTCLVRVAQSGSRETSPD
jgi:hypothetical protein